MVVQHNLIAINSNRMLGVTSNKQSKSSEKLSSGYRINRAADDAAGLSISEKMRKQIKGLDRSSTNAQDGVSSVQTAEGALAEVHSMLQRMNELSIQAANGTNSVDDRDAIQAEIAQLSTEIDRVAETTKFNETYLLKGSDAKTRHYPMAHDAGLKGALTNNATTGTFEIPTFWPDDQMVIGGVEYTIGSSKEDAEEVIRAAAADVDNFTNLALNANNSKAAYRTKANSNANLAQNATTANDRNFYNTYSNTYSQISNAYGTLENEYKNLIENKEIKIGENTYTATYNAATSPAVTWTEAPSGNIISDFPNAILPVPSGVVVEYTTSPANSSSGNIAAAATDAEHFGTAAKNAESIASNYAGTISNTYSPLYNEAAAEYRKMSVDYATLVATPYADQSEREVLVGSKTYVASYNPTAPNGVVWTEYFSGDTTTDLAGTVSSVNPGQRVLYENITLNIMIDNENNGEGNGVDDNDPTLITADKAYEYINRELTAANNIGTTAQKSVVTTSVSERQRVVTFAIEKGYAEVNAALNFALHVGSDADMTNKIPVDIETMSTANLGLEGMNVSDDTGLAATYAIDAITDALSIVSQQRSALGAVQNRLEHTIDNLDNVVENTTAAESRIRDTDMADEMVEYSKNNILAQAGQAMLAQANQSAQGVLSLLQ